MESKTKDAGKPYCHKGKGKYCPGAFPEKNDYHPRCTECPWWKYPIKVDE